MDIEHDFRGADERVRMLDVGHEWDKSYGEFFREFLGQVELALHSHRTWKRDLEVCVAALEDQRDKEREAASDLNMELRVESQHLRTDAENARSAVKRVVEFERYRSQLHEAAGIVANAPPAALLSRIRRMREIEAMADDHGDGESDEKGV